MRNRTQAWARRQSRSTSGQCNGPRRFELPPKLERAQTTLEVDQRFRERILHEATYALWLRSPALSARRTFTPAQAAGLVILATLLGALSLARPSQVGMALIVIMSVGFVLGMIFRLALAWAQARTPARIRDGARPRDSDLPTYTVLVPLYHEANVLAELVDALAGLDYPRDRLQILLVLEEDDTQTRAAAALSGGAFEIIVVPRGEPRTKPKACNYALHFARGDYVVIYDAEDRPEPDQLRRAVMRFRNEPAQTACLQARLQITNARQRWIAAMFALDYQIWFTILLQGLDRLGLPIPLGGTSNHFRISALRDVGAWDPFNVTEDADLGMRLARLGYRVSMLDSTTFEEAPIEFTAWLRQRTRWLKGYMQTLLVHGRRCMPGNRRNTLCMLAFLGGGVWSALVNPVLWIAFVTSSVGTWDAEGSESLEEFACASGAGLFAANMALASLAGLGRNGFGRRCPVWVAVGFIAYWVLISVAAYRAVWHLIFKAHHWEKTPHGVCGVVVGRPYAARS
ncbi:MAG: glycosyltransferase [Alphaproteobacteria bacterium]|nr:glycosyltransferase [Alphaproteobacteria bacterium]